MFFAIITLLVSLYLAGIAAWFSIVGLLSIFSGAYIPALCMGIGIETAKVVSVSWLYRNWNDAGFLLKTGTLCCTLVAMILTSAGIFGFLSKAHFQQSQPLNQISQQIAMIDEKIKHEQLKIADNKAVIKQLDDTVQVLLNNEKVSSKGGAREVRQMQKEERDSLYSNTQESTEIIAKLEQEKLTLNSSVDAVKVEVQMISYLSEVLYGKEENPDKAVKILIMLIMVSFDPFAIILLMCANHLILNKRVKIPVITKEKDALDSESTLPTSSPVELVSYTFNFDVPVKEYSAEYTYTNTSTELVDLPEVIEDILDETVEQQEDTVDEEAGVIDVDDSNDVDGKSKIDKQVRLEKIKSKLKKGEIGWITPKK